MTVNCNLTESDYRAFRRHAMFRLRKMHWLFGVVLICLVSNLHARHEIRVTGVRQVAETRSHFFVITITGTGYVIPKIDLQGLDPLYDLRKRVAERAV